MRKTNANAPLAGEVRQGDHVLGPARAGVTVVAYCDFECPYCGRAYPILKRLRAELGDRMRLVFRHFPLSHKHPGAQQAAEAAEAAGAQGQFWAMHDLLFEHQDALERDDLRSYATLLGLDLARFDREVSTHVHADRVRRDVANGKANGVTGTPTFFVNGRRHTEEESLAQIVLEGDR